MTPWVRFVIFINAAFINHSCTWWFSFKCYKYPLGYWIRQTVQSETMGSLPGDVTVFGALRSWRATRGQTKPPRWLGKSGAFPPESQRQRDVRDPIPLIRGSGKDPPFTFAPAAKWSFHICVGSWRDADTCVCFGWTQWHPVFICHVPFCPFWPAPPQNSQNIHTFPDLQPVWEPFQWVQVLLRTCKYL